MAENYQELNRLLANRGVQRNPDAAASIANLFNNGPRQQANYLAGAKGGAQLADIMAQARQRQLAGVGREGLAKIAEDEGNFKLANMFRLGTTAEDVAHANQTFQDTTQRGKMFEQAADPNNLELMNREVLSQAKEPVSLAAVEGNSIVDRFKTAGHQSFAPTQVGQADIGQKKAQATAEYASARERDAQAERAREGTKQDKTQVVDTDQGVFVVNKTHPEQSLPAMFGGQPLKKPPKPVAEKIPEKILEGAMSPVDPKAPRSDPTVMAQRFVEEKQRLGPQATEADVIQSLRKQDSDAATDGGPPADLAGQGGLLTRMFGGTQQGNTSGQPYPDPNAVGVSPNFNGPNATMPASSTNIFQNGAPHPEGTKLRGPDGKLYVVQNGQPVLAQ